MKTEIVTTMTIELCIEGREVPVLSLAWEDRKHHCQNGQLTQTIANIEKKR
jgi:thioredoxin-like negative regulator of GroEL